MPSEAGHKQDWFKLLFVLLMLVGTIGLFSVTPGLLGPSLLSLVLTILFSPGVAWLERRGCPRALAILIPLVLVLILGAGAGVFAVRSGRAQWDGFRTQLPVVFDETVNRLQGLEAEAKNRFPFLEDTQMTETVVKWGQQTGLWFVREAPGLMGNVLLCVLLGPLLTFFFLYQGRVLRRRLFQLVPNRFFEAAFIVSHQISAGIAQYIRAKLLEAILVGLLTGVGLVAIDAPYAAVLAVVAGITNIIPYLGPLIGAAPGLAIALFSGDHSLLIGMAIVYGAANLVDNVLIFPILVAKLVKLHPLILIAVVALGQRYYGLVGMLISVPVATAVKVVLQELYQAIYGPRGLPEQSLE